LREILPKKLLSARFSWPAMDLGKGFAYRPRLAATLQVQHG
jgi:hypothetical protein